MRTTVAAYAATIALVGCGIGTEAHSTIESRLAKTEFALTETDTGAYQLFVTRDAIANGSQFLLSTSAIITDFGDPRFGGSLSRVVTFKRADGKVQMLEAQKGNVVDASLVKPNLIASFPIASETDTAVGLAFNEGMATLLLSYDWPGQGAGEFAGVAAFKHDHYNLSQRYIDEANTDASGRLTIRQIAEVDTGVPFVSVAELRYVFQPYNPDPTYEPRVQIQDYRTVGYIQSSPTFIEGTAGAKSYLSRFHPDKPLVYAISSNTPEEVKQAVRDGILYWNRAIGRDWIQVVDAPSGVTAPDVNYNVVQWVPERGAGAAYADAQLDPLTGQVQNAQIFFPSTFYLDNGTNLVSTFESRVHKPARQAAARATKPLDPASAATVDDSEIRPLGKLVGGCKLASAPAFAQAAKTMMRLDLSPEAMKQAALDYVRSTIAHEVGHTLGLEHNFAGSLGTNIPEEDVDLLLRQYFATGEWPEDRLPGSTVMDYPTFEDDVGIGARIRLGQPALPYDVLAIDNLYNGTGALLPEGGPLFCTDLEAFSVVDCAQFDRGSDVVATLRKQIKDSVDDAALEYLIWLRAAKDGDALDVFAATDPAMDANSAYARRLTVARLLSDQARLLSSDRAIGSPNIHSTEIHEHTLQRVGESIVAAGGYADFFARLPQNFDRKFYARLGRLLSRPEYTSGVSYTGKPWSFSDEELQRIRDYAPDYLERYHEAANNADVAVLSLQEPISAPAPSVSDGFVIIFESTSFAPPRWEAPVLTEELERLLADRVLHYVSATDGAFTAVVASASEPSFDVPIEGEPAEGEAPRRSSPPRDGEAGAVPQSSPSAGQPFEAAPAVTREVTLPKFKYPTELRLLAPGILSTSLSGDRLWAYDVRQPTYDAFEAQLQAAIGDVSTLQLAGSDEAARQWIVDNRDVLGAMSGILVQ